MANKKRVLTGDRPTGPLHLGHYVGTLANRVRLQEEYEVFLLIADYHALTTKPEKADILAAREYIREIVLDYLAVGIDPEKTTIYVQSDVPEVCELALLFSMLVTMPRIERIPTLKDMIRDQKIENPSMGLMLYPILQAADILHVKAEIVPVGKDQESHVELCREIARRFNYLYGEIFPEPEALIGDVPTLPGIDGRAKMSKSLGNAIFLSDPPEEVARKVMQMFTDPARIRPDIPADPDAPHNVVFRYHEVFNDDKAEVEELKARYRQGKVGDVEVKKRLIAALERFLAPIRERRAYYAARPHLIDEILAAGAAKVRPISQATLAEAREAMGLSARHLTEAKARFL